MEKRELTSSLCLMRFVQVCERHWELRTKYGSRTKLKEQLVCRQELKLLSKGDKKIVVQETACREECLSHFL